MQMKQQNYLQSKDVEKFIPTLGYGYNPETGISLGAACPWFDEELVNKRIRPGSTTAKRHEKFISTLEETLDATGSSIKVQVRSGLFKGEGGFTSLVSRTTSKRNLTYILSAQKIQTFKIAGALETLSELGKTTVDKIRNLMINDVDEAKKEYKIMTASMGETYLREVAKRSIVGVTYFFEATSEETLNEVQAYLKAEYGSSSGQAAFNHLRKHEIDGITVSIEIIAEGVSGAALQEIDLRTSDIQKIQNICLNALNDADFDEAPVVDYDPVPVWQVFALLPQFARESLTEWLSIDYQRDGIFKRLYDRFTRLLRETDFLEELMRVNELVNQRDFILQSHAERVGRIGLLREIGNKSLLATSTHELSAIDSTVPAPLGGIDFTKILPPVKERNVLINVYDFVARVNASYQGAPNGWSGSINMGLSLGVPSKSLIENISLIREPEGGLTTLLYSGKYLDDWMQTGTHRATPYLHIGGSGVDHSPHARIFFTNRFKAEDITCNYKLVVRFIDRKPFTIELPSWTVLSKTIMESLQIIYDEDDSRVVE